MKFDMLLCHPILKDTAFLSSGRRKKEPASCFFFFTKWLFLNLQNLDSHLATRVILLGSVKDVKKASRQLLCLLSFVLEGLQADERLTAGSRCPIYATRHISSASGTVLCIIPSAQFLVHPAQVIKCGHVAEIWARVVGQMDYDWLALWRVQTFLFYRNKICRL